jgi:hypothetical protein
MPMGNGMAIPPPLLKLVNTPVLRSELPAGFTSAKVTRLPADPRYHTLGAVRIDFSNVRGSESASFALFTTPAQAASFARTERGVRTGGLFHVEATAVGRFVVGVTAATRTQAGRLLQLAVAHLRRSERS